MKVSYEFDDENLDNSIIISGLTNKQVDDLRALLNTVFNFDIGQKKDEFSLKNYTDSFLRFQRASADWWKFESPKLS